MSSTIADFNTLPGEQTHSREAASRLDIEDENADDVAAVDDFNHYSAGDLTTDELRQVKQAYQIANTLLETIVSRVGVTAIVPVLIKVIYDQFPVQMYSATKPRSTMHQHVTSAASIRRDPPGLPSATLSMPSSRSSSLDTENEDDSGSDRCLLSPSSRKMQDLVTTPRRPLKFPPMSAKRRKRQHIALEAVTPSPTPRKRTLKYQDVEMSKHETERAK